MQLSQESYRTRWIVLVTVWAVAAFTLFQQAATVRDYLHVVGQLGLRGAPAASTPLNQIYPAFGADAQVWVRHALALLEGKDVRLRHTTIDNAPHGREVHWNSVWAWAIAGAGWVHHLFTGSPLESSVEKATIWLTPLVLLLLVITFSTWATRRAGLIAGVLIAVAMTCHDRIYEGFFPSYVDHHGLLTVAVFGTVLGAVLMGGGWWQERTDGTFALLPDSPDTARYGAVFSALSGACGLWVSAASVIPPIAIVGIAGLLAVVVQGRTARQQGATFDGNAWRLWGRVGAAGSLFFYMLEYFPGQMGFRLEPNHPFHALAWLGGGELIAQLGERWLGSRERRWTNLHQFVWPVLAVSIAPLTVLIGGTRVLSFADPFMSRLHNDYIQEFLPMWRTLRGFTAKMIFQVIVVDSAPLIAAIATLTYRRRDSPMVLWFATFVAALLTLMAWAQSRWLLNASGAQITLALVVLACWTTSYRPVLRWAAALALIGVLFVPTGVMRYVGATGDVKARRVAPRDAAGVLNRDIAAVLRATQPQGDIVLLASPNASTGIGYYGRFKTIGTLYWENRSGLKAAAALFGARSEEEAAQLIKARRITHIALVSDENFIVQYYQLLHPKATADEIRQSFGWRLFADKVVPQWLQMIPYKTPDDLRSLNTGVMLFKVNFEQSLAEAYYHVALTQISQDAYEEADRTLDILIKQAPQFYEPWLRRAELLLARRNWEEAARHFLKGISLAPEAERPGLYIGAAGNFYNQQQHAIAVQIYRTALAERRTPEIVCYLAWVLATSREDALRNGKEAQELAMEAHKADPNSPAFLNALAGALAENGRFADAVQFADRAVANARLRGEAGSAKIFEERLATIRSGKPLRY